jgi:hypothetical protein
MGQRVTWGVIAILLLPTSACGVEELDPPCMVSEQSTEVLYPHGDRLDVLFVIDSSEAMAPHRELLDQELPKMIEALVTGDYDPDDNYGPYAAPDVHIGIVSADMGDGVPDADSMGCSEHGDEGALRASDACAAAAEPFVWHYPGYHDDDASIATAQCNAVLEPGCSVAQPLEAALAALTEQPLPGFLRDAQGTGTSLIVVVFITAQDDCSLAHSLSDRPTPATCAADPSVTHAINRYVQGLRALRPDHETLVRTLTIAGIPQDLLVTADGMRRDQWFEGPSKEELLSDPRMQANVGRDGVSLEPACTRGGASAAPARRLVELASSLVPGESAVLQSICAEGWTEALERVLEGQPPGYKIGQLCLQRELPRDSDGLSDCRVHWTLPVWSDPAHPRTPSRCEERAFLRRVQREPLGGAGVVCEVRQVSVEHGATGTHVGSGDGFYIGDGATDPFVCEPGAQFLMFTEAARVPAGVRVQLTCSDTALLGEPAIGEPSCEAQTP